MPRTDVLPTYTNDLAGFAGILRVSVFSSQRRAADYFHLNRSTIVRYENEDLKPPLGYLTCLARLVIDKQKGSEQDRQNLLVQLNRAIRHNYDYEVPFQTWPELDAVADAYLVERGQKTDATASLPRPHSPTDPASPSPPLPAETPALPVFYTERPDEQSKLLDYIAIKHVPALVLWGAGGVGKSVLMAWLAAHVSEKFPDGQIWVELPDNVSPPTAVSEAQVHIARSLGVMLPGISPAEKAGQLRTLLAGKRCLLMVDNLNFATDLSYLHVTGLTGCLLVTTRYRKVADVLEAPLLSIKGMTPAEGLDLLVRWANYTVDSGESMHDFVERLGGLPLALKLCGARLREGESVAQVRTDFDQDNIDLGQFDLDDPQTPHDGLIRCFERSLSNLTESECQGFIQLGCFIGHFEVGAAAAVWHLSLSDSRRRLRRLHGLALLRRKANAYQLHPLLRDYARQKMAELPILKQNTYQRYAAYFIRHTLYHPELLADESLPPNLDHRWVDVVAAVQWAAAYDAELASTAALLAYGDRPALLEALGPTLPHTVEEYASTSETVYQGVWYELLGDLYLINNH